MTRWGRRYGPSVPETPGFVPPIPAPKSQGSPAHAALADMPLRLLIPFAHSRNSRRTLHTRVDLGRRLRLDSATIGEWQVPCVITASGRSRKVRSTIAGRLPKPLSRGISRRTCRKHGSGFARPPRLSETSGSTPLTSQSCSRAVLATSSCVQRGSFLSSAYFSVA